MPRPSIEVARRGHEAWVQRRIESGELVPNLPFRERIEFGFDLIEAVTDGASQSLTGRRGRHAARGAREKPDPQPLLQPTDGLAQR